MPGTKIITGAFPQHLDVKSAIAKPWVAALASGEMLALRFEKIHQVGPLRWNVYHITSYHAASHRIIAVVIIIITIIIIIIIMMTIIIITIGLHMQLQFTRTVRCCCYKSHGFVCQNATSILSSAWLEIRFLYPAHCTNVSTPGGWWDASIFFQAHSGSVEKILRTESQ